MNETKMDREAQAHSDLHTLIEYERICKDRSRFGAAMALKKKKMAELESAGEHEKKGK